MPYAAIDLFCGVGGLTKGLKKKRNSLAHGDESFSRCARDLTLTDLETIKDTVIQFIQEILTGMEKYCDEKQFLRHT